MPPAACRKYPRRTPAKKEASRLQTGKLLFFVVMTRYMDQLRVFAFTFEYVPQTFLPFTVV